MPPEPWTQRTRVLLVDDDQILLRATRRALESFGHEVVTSSSGADALEQLEQGAFDVVLSDVHMPGFSGLRLLREVRQRAYETPVILMTGDPEVESAAAAIEHRAFQYLIKPVAMERLREAVQRALEAALAQHSQRGASVASSTRVILGEAEPGAGEHDSSALRLTLEPIVRASSGLVFGYRALWLSGSGTVVSHPRAPDAGGWTAIALTLEALTGGEPLFVSVTWQQLQEVEALAEVAPLARAAFRVVLEVGGEASVEAIGHLRERITRLRGRGFRLALPNLGVGYAALSSFATLEPEFVELDASIVRHVHESPTKQKIVTSLARLCGEMGLELLAAGIEHCDEREALVTLGCHLLAGPALGSAIEALPA